MIRVEIGWKAALVGLLFYLLKDSATWEAVKKNTADSEIIFGSDRTEYIKSRTDNDLRALCEDIYNPNNKPEVIYERPKLRTQLSSR